jgi:hypothetical protein
MLNDFVESKVTVKKDALLEALRSNREKHGREYKEAYEGYKAAFVQEAVQLLESAKAGNFEKRVISCSAPEDHSRDYDRVIRMMEMCVADEITLSENQFSQFVLDEWQWMNAFNTSKMRYSNGR